MMEGIFVTKIEGFKVFFSDGDVLKKDVNSIWLYHIYMGLTPWENRQWYTDENGRLELEFPEL